MSRSGVARVWRVFATVWLTLAGVVSLFMAAADVGPYSREVTVLLGVFYLLGAASGATTVAKGE